MSDREKLIEILEDAESAIYWSSNNRSFIEDIADHLISNGVTLGADTKPLKQFLTQIDEYAGLKLKFLVFKADTGERVENCFVLRPDKDAAAVEALRAYAEATDNKTLSDDIYNWVGKGVTVQKWIPVSDRLPEESGRYIVSALDGRAKRVTFCDWQKRNRLWNLVGARSFWSITHWMPMPLPPKECE